MRYHLFQLRNNKLDWIFLSESAVYDVCAYESQVPLPKADS
jgi:hypothetical protein